MIGRKPGRPPILDSEGARTVRVEVRLSEQTVRSIAALSAAEGIPAATWIARAAAREAAAASCSGAGALALGSMPTPGDSR